MNTTAVIAEDEPLLAQALRAELAVAWPELEVLEIVGDGASAVRSALRHRPAVLFFDIRMPGQGGLEAAAELADAWPQDAPFPALVFVTAYDQYALQAFEAQAIDYLLKPVQPARLRRTVDKLRQALARQQPQGDALEATLGQLRHLLQASGPAAAREPLLKVIQAGVGSSIRLVPVEQVVYFEAADKYVRAVTAGGEVLLHRDDFRSGLGQWLIEAERGGRFEARAGVLDIDSPAGVTLWFRPALEGPVAIDYEVTAVAEDGPNDEVSDVNCFWMATDSRVAGGDVLARPRSGAFADYDELRTYYAGIGGNPLDAIEVDRRQRTTLLPGVDQRITERQIVATAGGRARCDEWRVHFAHDTHGDVTGPHWPVAGGWDSWGAGVGRSSFRRWRALRP
jgi:DNA-binding LytR/AlgR family response regulator